MSTTKKIHINFNMEDELEKNAYEILLDIKKKGVMKRYIAEAIILAEQMQREKRDSLESLGQAIERHEKEITYICKQIGVTLP